MVERIGPKRPRQAPYLREWRKFRKLTQQALADRIGVDGTTKATISRYETGKRDYPGGFLAAFAEAVQCREDDLFRLPNDSPSLDAMLRNAPEAVKKKVFELVEVLLKTGT